MMKIEITKEKKQDAKFKRSGGEPQDYLAILSEAIASICKEEGLPIDIAVKGLFRELGEGSSEWKFKAKPKKPFDPAFDDPDDVAWFEDLLDEDGYIHGWYVDGYIVGNIVEADDEYIAHEFRCSVDKETVEVVK